MGIRGSKSAQAPKAQRPEFFSFYDEQFGPVIIMVPKLLYARTVPCVGDGRVHCNAEVNCPRLNVLFCGEFGYVHYGHLDRVNAHILASGIIMMLQSGPTVRGCGVDLDAMTESAARQAAKMAEDAAAKKEESPIIDPATNEPVASDRPTLVEA